MKFTRGDGSLANPFEILTTEGFAYLTGERTIPEEVPVALPIERVGNTYHVEDVVSHWPGDPIPQLEFDQRICKMKRTANYMGRDSGSDSVFYAILDPDPKKLNELLRGDGGTTGNRL